MSTGGPRSFRTIREEPSYAECVEELGGYGRVDELTGHLRWRLSRDPLSWSWQVRPSRQTRVAFTEQLGSDVPVFRIFFTVPGDDLGSLLWIEEADDAPPLGFDDLAPMTDKAPTIQEYAGFVAPAWLA